MEPDNIEPAIWRLVDSSLNRATEAIRVIEDCLRFGLEDARSTESAKNLRHNIASLLQTASDANPDLRRNLSRMRDSPGDVGRTITTPTEKLRSGLEDLLIANFKRLQQALRTLEETSKVIDQEFAAGFEQLRYDAYSLEKQGSSVYFNRELLQHAWLCVLTDGCQSSERFASKIGQLVNAGVPLIQLRDKTLSDRDLIGRGLMLHEMTRDTSTNWIFNDRVDLALACKADGIHLGQDDMPVSVARQLIGPNKLIGASTHSIDQVDQAIDEGADYLGVGPVFTSQTKSFVKFVGLDLLTAVAQRTGLPAYAIGGINLKNANHVFETGIHGIAVAELFSDSHNAADVFNRLKSFRQNTTSTSDAC